jgi:2-keto-3-deoxy-L-rhamnonate aldolase RhmA
MVLFLHCRPLSFFSFGSHAQKYLVAGAQGILLPQCESKLDVEKLVDAVKFPPVGQRGLAGERWNAWAMARRSDHDDEVSSTSSLSLADCVAESNRNSVVGVLVETHGDWMLWKNC